ncbi:MAG: PAS domain-containing protein [Acidobacteriota bacterium]
MQRTLDATKTAQAVFPDWHRTEAVDELSEDEFDDLPFGAIRLDAGGVVTHYNGAEAKISGRQKGDVIGRNFFTEVAPCTDVQSFAGRFREGVEREDLNHVFPYTFDVEMRPTEVWIRLYYSKNRRTAWVFVVRLKTEEERQ